ncbi:MAG: nucleotidyltransferase family protein [Burkholderiales bacterium]
MRASELTLRSFGVKSLALFGSIARGDAGPQSDVDMLVEFDGPGTFDGYMNVKLYLEDLIGKPIDLVTRAALHPRLRPTVEREAVRVA